MSQRVRMRTPFDCVEVERIVILKPHEPTNLILGYENLDLEKGHVGRMSSVPLLFDLNQTDSAKLKPSAATSGTLSWDTTEIASTSPLSHRSKSLGLALEAWVSVMVLSSVRPPRTSVVSS
jgi:hypothetical protein